MSSIEAILLLTVSLPAILPAVALLVRRESTGRAALAGSAVGFAGAVALLAANAIDGPVSLLFTAGQSPQGLHLDRVSSILFLLVTGVLVTVHGFASRYLLGDPRAARFFALSGATATAILIAASASTLTTLTAGWCAAGGLLCLMLLHRPDLAEARLGARRTALSFAIGDGALLAAVAIVLATGPDLDLRSPGQAAASLADRELAGIPVASLVAVLIGICALARSAQFPIHRWLPSTLAAPTPVSALLHAGLVNGGGLLLITLAPVVALEPGMLWTLLAAGLVTTLLGTALSLVRSDVKGSLAWSTTAQMGFMVAQCATGGFAAALLHMFGHGIYKANLFLGSGGAVAARRRSVAAPQPGGVLPGPARLAAAVTIPTILMAASLALIAPDLIREPGVPILLAFALATASRATWSWLSSAAGLGARSISIAAALLAAATAAYVSVVALFEGFVAGELPALAGSTPPAWVLPAILAAAATLAVSVRVAGKRDERAAGLELSAWAAARALSDPAPLATAGRSPEIAEPIPAPRPATIGAIQ